MLAELAADLFITALTAAWTFLATVHWHRPRRTPHRPTSSWANTSRRNR
ncbi:hypothetical protein [Streptomyces pseudovenezuelae]|nr:hypothetical protein [Streptomyces pseudovenezuelae]